MKFDSSSTLSAMVYGVHFDTPKYMLANCFNEIIDAFYLIEDVDVRLISHKSDAIVVKIDNFAVHINVKNIVISSSIFFHKELADHFKDKKTERISYQDFYGDLFDKQSVLILSGPDYKNYTKDFIKSSVEFLELIYKICGHLFPKIKFVGLVEYHCLKLGNDFEWTLYKKYDSGAALEGWVNKEKKTHNRYEFDDKDGSFRYLNFDIANSEVRSENICPTIGAVFDYQIVPKVPCSFEEIGTPKDILSNLRVELVKLQDSAELLKVVRRKREN
jgi:hypothetical protein